MDVSFEEFVELLGVSNDQQINLLDESISELITSETVRESPPCAEPLVAYSPQTGTVSPQPILKEEETKFLLKAAKCREDQYEAVFPTTMTCAPYKYDLKILGTLQSENEKTDLKVDLVDAETNETPENHASETRPGVTVESVEIFSKKERVVRFALNWCSFHFKKRAFKLRVSCKGKFIFYSSPFHTYARRRDTPYQRDSSISNALPSTTYIPAVVAKQAAPTFVQQKAQQKVCLPLYYAAPSSPQKQKVLQPTQQNLCKLPPVTYLPVGHTAPKQAQTQCNISPAVNNYVSSFERTSMAIQLMTSLSPVERQAVNYYLQGL